MDVQLPPLPTDVRNESQIKSSMAQHIEEMVSLIRRLPVSDILEVNLLPFFLKSILESHGNSLLRDKFLILKLVTEHLKEAFHTGGDHEELKTKVARLFDAVFIAKLIEFRKSEDFLIAARSAAILQNIAHCSSSLGKLVKISLAHDSLLHLLKKKPEDFSPSEIAKLIQESYDSPRNKTCTAQSIWMFWETEEKSPAVKKGLGSHLLPTIANTLSRLDAPVPQLLGACALVGLLLIVRGPKRRDTWDLCLPLSDLLEHKDREVAAAALACVGCFARRGTLESQLLVDCAVSEKVRPFLADDRDTVVLNALCTARCLASGRKPLSATMANTWFDDRTLQRLVCHRATRVVIEFRKFLATVLD